MSEKKRGIQLKNLEYRDEGLQELINPVPLDLIDEQEEADALQQAAELESQENQAVQDVIVMLEDTHKLLD